MQEIILWIICTGLLLGSFIVLLVWGLLKKRRIVLISSLVTLLFAVGCGSWTGYLFLRKAYHKLSFKPRTGEEIYTALFGAPDNFCLKVINHQDQIVPRLDPAILLQFETCPDELQRILRSNSYQTEKQSTKGLETAEPSANNNWFKPELLGDSIWVFRYKKDEYGNEQTIYSSLDSTEVFCKDIAD